VDKTVLLPLPLPLVAVPLVVVLVVVPVLTRRRWWWNRRRRRMACMHAACIKVAQLIHHMFFGDAPLNKLDKRHGYSEE
jgi:hypothetical protein